MYAPATGLTSSGEGRYAGMNAICKNHMYALMAPYCSMKTSDVWRVASK